MISPSRPEWLQVLAAACEATSQADVSRRLGISASSVCLLLKGTYKGRLDHMEARVRGELMARTVQCPVLGEMSTRQCCDEQKKPYWPNPLRSALFKACKTCPHASQPTSRKEPA